MLPKKKWAAFMLAVVPGLGHLYLGLNRRGLKFMIGAFLCISLIPMLPMVFPFAVAVIWFYSLFDALQKATLINMVYAQKYLDGKEDNQLLTLEKLNELQDVQKDIVIEPVWMGIGAILIGILLIIHSVFPKVWYLLTNRQSGSVLFAIVMIGIGLWILYRNNQSTQE